jgi:hypothetical protein
MLIFFLDITYSAVYIEFSSKAGDIVETPAVIPIRAVEGPAPRCRDPRSPPHAVERQTRNFFSSLRFVVNTRSSIHKSIRNGFPADDSYRLCAR